MILALIEHYADGNKARFANILGISPQGLSTWIKRDSFDIELVFSKCEGLSAQWLLTGCGEMLKTNRTSDNTLSPCKPISEVKVTQNSLNDQVPVAQKQPEGSHEGIPLIPFASMAGALMGEQTALEYECERYVVPAFKGADFLIPVKGSSMYPKYSTGDIVACQRVPMSDLFFQWNKVYVLDTSQGPLIKRIKPGSAPDKLLIVSDNEQYDPFELPISTIRAVALVIGVIRLE